MSAPTGPRPMPAMPDTVQVKGCCGLLLTEPCDCAELHAAWARAAARAREVR